MIDLRDVIHNQEDDPEEYDKWNNALQDALGKTIEDTAKDTPIVIAASEFEDYAEGYAQDMGYVSRDVRWPANHIDWEAAANELKNDYRLLVVEGEDYYIQDI